MQQHFYATSGFDRMAHFRDDDQQMENRLKAENCRFVPVWNDRVFTSKDRSTPRYFSFEELASSTRRPVGFLSEESILWHCTAMLVKQTR